jgi:hypothetical protein
MIVNIRMCTTATTTMSTTAYAVTIMIKNNKLHKISLGNYKMLIFIFLLYPKNRVSCR